jgi:hypothetical protein
MATEQNIFERKIAELERQGEVRYLNTDKDLRILERMNQELDEVQREYKIKEQQSQEQATKVILTT